MFGKGHPRPKGAKRASKRGPPKGFGWAAKAASAISNFSIETAFAPKRQPPAPRSVYFNEPLPAAAFDHKGRPLKSWTFATNQVLTARYTAYNFVIKNLLEQYRRVANWFFTVIVILQFFPQFATINPIVAMLPLLAVLAISMVKDGYEDIKRHQADRQINRLKVRVLAGGGWTNPNVMQSKNRNVGAFFARIWNSLLGGKRRQNKKVAEHARELSAGGPAAVGETPMAPPADAPGGGAAPVGGEGELAAGRASTDSAAAPLARHRTSQSSVFSGMSGPRRTGSMAVSAFGSEYQHGDDGRIRKGGKLLTPEEEAAYWAKRSPKWRKKMWEDLAVGDFVLLKNNESIPADIVICSTSEEEDSCFIETKNLDGETNLKSRHAVPELAQTIRNASDCARALLRVDAEPQDVNMYRLNASVVIGDRFDKDGQPLRCPVTLNQVLLRGCNLRNTKWVIGMVLMTGSDTKVVANSGVTPSKRGKVEKQMNPMVYSNLLLLACVVVACSIADSILEQRNFDRQAYWEVGATRSDDNPRINGLITFGNALITFQNIVPISLYISIEVVRTVQAYFIFDDYDIYYEKTNRRTTARSWNLTDDLGQIQYIFSDKTGTLTQNLMIFREFAVGGVVYRGSVPAGGSSSSEGGAAGEKAFSSASSRDSGDFEGRKRVRSSNPEVPPFRDSELNAALRDPNTAHGRLLGAFWRCLALCHTVLTAEDKETGILEYRAQSPDEQALVQAAAEVGFTFLGKDRNTLRIQVPGGATEEYELLNVIEFSSARKRMSVILRREADGKVLVLAKGADSIMFERAAPGQDDVKAKTDEALEEFANKGLRTLCLGSKEVEAAEYEEWAKRYHDASVSIDQREEKMETLASEFERNFTLLGATAIEDRLQDGVPETIADLKRAGIKVWVATGDKLETAIAIGYSTMLLTQDMNLIVVRGGEYGQPNSAYDQLRKAIERFFGGREALLDMEHQPPDWEDDDEGATGRRRSRSARRSSIRRSRSSIASQASLVGEDNGRRPGGYALVIDGSALGHALSEEFSKELLLNVSTQCRAVICCRVSPLQKAQIVRLVKDGLNVMTLAIGDGANDVSMIQAAHVGVGIAGEEGLQAVNSSDYAIAQFRFLKKLLLVHGHWSYYRNGSMILNFFYKNAINVAYLFWFQVYCLWSTTQALVYIYILLWNAIWTVAAVIGVGCLDRDVSDKTLMALPELYSRGREGKYFSLRLFGLFLLDGIYQGAVLLFFIANAYDTTTARTDGYDIQLYEWSTVMAVASVWIANLFIGLNVRAWSWWMGIFLWFGPILITIFWPIYSAFSPKTLWSYSYGNNAFLWPSAYFWFCSMFVFVLCLLPRFVWKHIRQTYYPTDIDIVRPIEKYYPGFDFSQAAPRGAHVAPASEVTGAPSFGETDAEHQGVPLQPLRPTESRGSIHHDMATGIDSPARTFSFSAEDGGVRGGAPASGKRNSLVGRLIPGSLRRKKNGDAKSRLSTVVQTRGPEEDEEEEVEEDDDEREGVRTA